MGFINISDGSITPTPPPPYEGSDGYPNGPDVYAEDEQFANVYWQLSYGAWVMQMCPAGTIYDPHVQPGPVSVFPQDYHTAAPYALNDPSLEGKDYK
jgi:hypothetical protein